MTDALTQVTDLIAERDSLRRAQDRIWGGLPGEPVIGLVNAATRDGWLAAGTRADWCDQQIDLIRSAVDDAVTRRDRRRIAQEFV